MCGFLFLFLNTALSIEGDLNVTVVFWNGCNGMGFLKYQQVETKKFLILHGLVSFTCFQKAEKAELVWQ